jgi:hypothetical protein
VVKSSQSCRLKDMISTALLSCQYMDDAFPGQIPKDPSQSNLLGNSNFIFLAPTKIRRMQNMTGQEM